MGMRRIAEKLGNEMNAKIFLIELDKQKKIIPFLKSIISKRRNYLIITKE